MLKKYTKVSKSKKSGDILFFVVEIGKNSRFADYSQINMVIRNTSIFYVFEIINPGRLIWQIKNVNFIINFVQHPYIIN